MPLKINLLQNGPKLPIMAFAMNIILLKGIAIRSVSFGLEEIIINQEGMK
jgi:hypothetical protein